MPGIITICDQTLREGMQFRGIVFSAAERRAILEFQEKLGVDICAGGYPSAHSGERDHLAALHRLTRTPGSGIRVSGLGRATPEDVNVLLSTGVKDIHLHAAFPPSVSGLNDMSGHMERVDSSIRLIRQSLPEAAIVLNMLDIGRVGDVSINHCLNHIASSLAVDVCMLPDTSGVMTPDRIAHLVRSAVASCSKANMRIGVHCHNDLGMATANTVMGALSGADHVDASVLGIGERNGIADLFLVGKILKERGYEIRLKVDHVSLFRQYYEYVDRLCRSKTGVKLLGAATPFFGDAAWSHVAGTHADAFYGVSTETEQIFLNVLCGTGLVEKYLKIHGIDFSRDRLRNIVARIKDRSALLNRALLQREVVEIVKDSNI